MNRPTRVTSPKQLADLRQSGLTEETWAAASVYTESDPVRIGEMLGWNGPARSLGPVLVFSYHGLDGELSGYCRVKPNEPRAANGDGKAVKYEAPRGRPPHAYFPPQCRQEWRSGGPLLIVEGEKKALCGCQNGFPTIGLSGVWSCRRKGEQDLLPELLEVPWKGRQVYIVFDSDRESNAGVRKAEEALGAALDRHGAEVWIVALKPGPKGEKTGLDDFFARGRTPDQFRALLAAAARFTGGGRPEYDFTDIGNGRRLADAAGTDLRYVADRDCWLAWDGRRWVERGAEVRVEAIAKDVLVAWTGAGVARVSAAAKAFAEAHSDEDKDRAKRALGEAQRELGFAKRSQDWRAVKRMIAAARSEPSICVASYRVTFDRHPWLLNCANGTVDLRTGELRRHERGDYLTKLSPVVYDPAAEAPLYREFLSDVFARRPELIDYVRRLSGVACTGDVTTRTLHVFYGRGSNGKSVLIELWMEVLGPDEYALKLPDSVLVTEATNNHPTELADLAGTRFAVANETEQSGKLAEGRVKALTGGDTVAARKMRQDYFRFDPTYKLVMASNHKPRIRGTDVGIWSRIRLVPFDVRFWKDDDQAVDPGREYDPALKADPRLKAKLLAEAPGVLADMVRKAGEFYRSGLKLSAPKAVLAATRDYQQAEDTLGEFFAERVVRDPEAAKGAKERNRVTGAELYRAYRQWSDDRREKPIGTRTFGEDAKIRFDHVRSGGVIFYYVTLRAGPPPDAGEPAEPASSGEGGEGGGPFPDERLGEVFLKGGYAENTPHPPHPHLQERPPGHLESSGGPSDEEEDDVPAGSLSDFCSPGLDALRR